ncbi:MAG: tannase/feruloyl esterase family alpha/beta hydrolase [Acidobacteria bacterium]|nr:tannase/feruloyl esterase family alpha/beta hydrolase [Acidobacteriota bacterium]
MGTGSMPVRGQTAAAVAPAQMRGITEAECAADRLGSTIPASAIGEPVSAVVLQAPAWTAATATVPAFCSVTGAMAPVDTAPNAQPINFRVVLPSSWNGRAIQMGGGGFNGVIPNLTAPIDSGPNGPARGIVTYGSDSGHRMGPGVSTDWTLNDEAIRNLGYMQMKKTRDAAMVIVQRAYGATPTFNYYVGNSQGGREALTVAQRYPNDYHGIISNVPIVNFSSLMLAPELIRIQEKPLANWVTRAKVATIRDQFMRTCDGLDGRVDGVMNNYMACRAIFDVKQGEPGRRPWASKRCPNNVDPNPDDTSPDACLTDGQISTLEFVYSRYRFATPLAHGVSTFGMWVPTTDPSGSGLIEANRYIGQEGAPADARMHAHLGVLGVTGFLMRNVSANPLDYVEGGPLNARRVELSPWLDSTNPDLSAFRARGGRMIVTIGTDDTLASPGAQLDYYQSVIDTMGRTAVDSFARLFVIPQANHGLRGQNAARDGNGQPIAQAPLPVTFDKVSMLFDWVERGIAPALHGRVTAGERSLPLCSYPAYPHYAGGSPDDAASYRCGQP